MGPRLLRRGAALLTAIACFLLGLELLVRLAGPVRLGFEYRNGGLALPFEFLPDVTANRWRFHDVDHGPKRDAERRVILLGDSMTHAVQVSVAQTVGRRLAHHLSTKRAEPWDVASLAGPAWSLYRELEALREYGPVLAPDWVLTIFGPSAIIEVSPDLRALQKKEIADTRRGRRPSSNRIELDEARFLFFPRSVLNQLVSFRLTWASISRKRTDIPTVFAVYETPPSEAFQRAWQFAEKALRETRSEVESLGARYAVVAATTPWGMSAEGLERVRHRFPAMQGREWDVDLVDVRLAEVCERIGIPFLALHPAFRQEHAKGDEVLHFTYDAHWTAAGNDLAGRRIADFVLALEAGGPRVGGPQPSGGGSGVGMGGDAPGAPPGLGVQREGASHGLVTAALRHRQESAKRGAETALPARSEDPAGPVY